jgi:hypothetical protein
VVRKEAVDSKQRADPPIQKSLFAEDDGIDGHIRFMCAKPRHDPRVGRWFRPLAQNIGID